ncbi:methylhydantoinase [Betaproteobacteria bacterium]|nr:methylhydantoinase [Betaproteobacteria bacterium]
MAARDTSTPIRLAVDVGGTFTDIVLLKASGRFSAKVLTTAGEPERGVLEGIDEILAQADVSLSQVELLILGTTLATNALIERKGARTALITTHGFRDLLEIGLEDRFAQYDVFLEKAPPLVPRPLRFGISERINGQGRILRALEEEQVRRLVPQLEQAQIESVAVVFLHGYANPVHERRVRDILHELAPHLAVSLSSEVCPEIREFERLSTTCANAYIQPLVAGYLERLYARLTAAGLTRPPFLMTSGGGICALEVGISHPVRLVESGPAGGAVLAAGVARQLNDERVLSFDMGGTTAKICFIDDFTPQVSRSFEFGRVHRHLKGSGLPIRIPVIEMVEIGAGGGSIARVDELGRLHVGPDSAGSEPGPASYGRGGQAATVTDANLALGLLDPARFARGKLVLDPERATHAIGLEVGTRLALGADEAAGAITEIVTENMANAARVHASELGKNIEAYTLVAFGGAAPLHAATLARKLKIRKVIIPQAAGVGSALGFLWAPISYQTVRSQYQPLDAFDLELGNALLHELRDEAVRIVRQAAPGAHLEMQRIAYMRYAGQGHEIAVTAPGGELTPDSIETLSQRFAATYIKLFGRALAHVPVEVVSWSVTVSAPPVAADTMDSALLARPATTPGARTLFTGEAGGTVDAIVVERSALGEDTRISGPALIVEDETTTYVKAGFSAWRGTAGHLILEEVEP